MTYRGTSFSKMSGTGNDFIVIDNTARQYDFNWSEFAKIYCRRRISVGADGILVLEAHTDCDFNYRIFNADGSEAEMCGNGARCVAQFAFDKGITGNKMRFMTLAGIIEARVNQDDVAIKMTAPQRLRTNIAINLNGCPATVHHIDTGVPHTIMFSDDIKGLDVAATGRAIRYHEQFAPAGTNADFIGFSGSDSIIVRTYERGVEAETLACGTGAVAAAIISHATGNMKTAPITVQMPGGQLKIDFKHADGGYTDVWLIGKVETVYQAQIS